LFGDTFAEAAAYCSYPVALQDDLAARIPRTRPGSLQPGAPAALSDACSTLQYPLEDETDPTSWRRMRLFPDPSSRAPERALDTGLLRAPVTAFSDGVNAFMYFYRSEYARCATNSECGASSQCTTDPGYTGKRIGGCLPSIPQTTDPAPEFCVVDSDCSAPALCAPIDHGVCVADAPFTVQRGEQRISPDWYAQDPRDGIISEMHIASALWPERPEDWATGFRFATNKFVNATARTVAHFDPQHPELNDYNPGSETLLMWGRPAWIGHDEFQALPFLLYQPLAGLIDASGAIAWAPRYFAGYDAAGQVIWSSNEADALPVYGIDENLTQQPDGQWAFDWRAPEFDYVNHASMTWLQPLGRWLMIYGGHTPGEVANGGTDMGPTRNHPQPLPGAVHMRTAMHPWGRANTQSPAADGFSAPQPLLARAALAQDLACSEGESSGECNPALPKKPGTWLDALGSAAQNASPEDFAAASAQCAAGNEAIGMQFEGQEASGHFYGAAIIEAWTEDVSALLPEAEPAVELYWNVSTWNPYQVLLMKSQLRASDLNVAP
jgi:hypothetical protein